MLYRLFISEAAREQLRSLPKDVRRNIGFRIEALQHDLVGDVKKLSGKANLYRLRVGNHRVLFRLVGDAVEVYAVKDRTLMSDSVTVEQLAAEMRRLRQRVEDLEDAHDLEVAIRENQGAPLISWETAKQDLGL